MLFVSLKCLSLYWKYLLFRIKCRGANSPSDRSIYSVLPIA